MAIFQKKIIIGSVLGFVASAIGIAAVFFPSFFNLEKQSMDTYKGELRTEKDAERLYKFLKSNENKAVQLELRYTEGQFYRFVQRVKDAIANEREFILDRNGDLIETSSPFNYTHAMVETKASIEMAEMIAEENKKSEKRMKELGIEYKLMEHMPHIVAMNTHLYSKFGDELRFSVGTSGVQTDGISHFSRDSGEWSCFGFWLGELNPKTKDETQAMINKSYQIRIGGNKLYSLRNESRGIKEEVEKGTGIKMVLSGAFFVHPQAQIHNVCMSSKYAKITKNSFPDSFILEPVSTKDIQLEKYR